jgi:hypothetical protein
MHLFGLLGSWKAATSTGFHKQSLLQLLPDYSSSNYFFITAFAPLTGAHSPSSRAHFLSCRAAWSDRQEFH